MAKSRSTEFADSPIDRALGLIAPSKSQRDDCRENLRHVISEIADTVPRRSMTESKQFATVAYSLRNTRRAIKKLPPFHQLLLLSQPPFRFSRPRGLDLLKRHLAAFFDELNKVAAWADQQSNIHQVPPSDRRRDYQKLEAAHGAVSLSFEFGSKPPRLTPGSAFLELASTLYEAATGKVDVDLRWQCRTVIAEQKQK